MNRPPAPVRFLLSLAALVAAFFLLEANAQAPAPPADEARKARGLAIANKPWQGDFDRMLERRMIRIAAPYSRSLYFNDQGRERGLAAEFARDFEMWLNRKHAKQLGKRPLTVYLFPATRDKLISDLPEGLADISIGNLTVTPERLQVIDFVSPPSAAKVDEIIVTGPASPELRSLEDLAGQAVHVRPASSYHTSLLTLNDRFRAEGRPEVRLVLVPDALEDEDMMEMMAAGLIGLMVADDWKAKMWAQVLPKLRVRADLILRDDGRTGWAIRKGSPQLAAEIEDFHKGWIEKHGLQRTRLASYMKRVRSLRDPTGSDEWKRFSQTLDIFEKYGQRYNFDPLMLAAQGYQESQLRQEARSHVGAIGVMQIMPATGADMKVGDIAQMEPNIHAGAKYMDLLMTRFFPDAKFSDGNRPLFAFASYNAGPGRIAGLRKEAEKRGLDPNRWFNNVEIIVAEKVGTETTTYVRNIYKYYVAYRLTLDAREQAQKVREQVPAR